MSQKRSRPPRPVHETPESGERSRRRERSERGAVDSPRVPPQGHLRGDERRLEAKVYGFNACMTLFKHRPEQIVRGYFAEAMAKTCGPVMKYLAANKKSYHIVSEEELNRVTASTHHEGICLLVKKSSTARIAEWCQQHRKATRLTMVALEGVSNPHNLGAILRTCAHYGVAAVAIEDASLLQSGAAVRTAEGGAEHVEIVVYRDMRELLETARKYKLDVVGTSSHEGRDLFSTPLPDRSLLLIGEEARGLSRRAMESSQTLIRIPGTGQVESLNVSAATAVILGEFWRQSRLPAEKSSRSS